MRRTGIAEFINALDDGVQSRVETDRIFGLDDVVVDGSGQADAIDAHFRQR